MMRSMYAGVSGLRNHQLKMDVIGNNIANVNTISFKKGRVNFQEMFYQTLRGASSPQGWRGGTNPRQIGLGVAIASIDTIHTPGSSLATGKMSDLMIEGDGFFVMDNNGQSLFTRAGTFDFDRDGNFINPANGMKVKGWMADPLTRVIDSTKAMDNITVPQVQLMKPLATKNIGYANNLDAAVPVGTSYPAPPVEVYDSLGNPHHVSMIYEKTATNTWSYTVNLGTDDKLIQDYLVSIGYPTATFELQPANIQALLIKEAQAMVLDGSLQQAALANTTNNPGLSFTAVTPGALREAINIEIVDAVGTNPVQVAVSGNSITLTIDSNVHNQGDIIAAVAGNANASSLVVASTTNGAALVQANGAPEFLSDGITYGAGQTGELIFTSTGALNQNATSAANGVTPPFLTQTFSFAPAGAETVSITPDISAITQYNSESTVRAQSRDGNSPGTLQTYTIDSAGVISGVYSNGLSLQLAQIALAKFNAPGGLIKMGENLYQESNNSGESLIGAPGTQGIGLITPGALEMSNVDLAQEFSDMIVTQRGFQANSRIITTSDQMLEELVNLKR